MAVTITVDQRLDVTVESDTYPTVILGLVIADSSNTDDVYGLVQTEALTEAGIAIRPYGLVVIPNTVGTTQLTFVVENEVTHVRTTMAATAINSLVRGATVAVAGG